MTGGHIPAPSDGGGTASLWWGRLVRAWPGLAIAVAAAGVGFLVNRWVVAANPMAIAILLGMAMTAVGGNRPVFRPGLRLASATLLRVGIVLLGLRLAIVDILGLGVGTLAVVLIGVACGFLVTTWVAGRLGVSAQHSLLVAAGVSVCGASAVAAMRRAVDADEQDVVTAVAVVTALGTSSLLVVPVVGGKLLGLDRATLGAWAGASVHEVGQVVAVGGIVGGAALTTAVVVKLFRVALLAPMIAIVSLTRRRSAGPARRPPILPWFVIGFLVMAVARSTGAVPAPVGELGVAASNLLMAAAMFALGAAVDFRAVARSGGAALAAGAAGTVALAGTTLLGLAIMS